MERGDRGKSVRLKHHWETGKRMNSHKPWGPSAELRFQDMVGQTSLVTSFKALGSGCDLEECPFVETSRWDTTNSGKKFPWRICSTFLWSTGVLIIFSGGAVFCWVKCPQGSTSLWLLFTKHFRRLLIFVNIWGYPIGLQIGHASPSCWIKS